jgi:hypothetical protein
MDSFFVKLAGSQLIARILGQAADEALPPAQLHGGPPAPAPAAPAAAAPAKKEEPNPLVDGQGVIRGVKQHELSPAQVDHVLNRIHYDKKFKDLALEIAEMRKAQRAARPFERG